MRQETFPLLRCPNRCPNPLELETLTEKQGRTLTGFIHCAGCGSHFPIEDGITRMMPKELHDQQITPEIEAEIRQKKERNGGERQRGR